MLKVFCVEEPSVPWFYTITARYTPRTSLNCFFLHSLGENKVSKKYVCQDPARIKLRNQHNLLQIEDYSARKGKKNIYPEAMFSTDGITVCRE